MLSDLATVLLVDDENAVRRLMSHALTAGGYAVLEAADGQEALRLAAAYRGQIDLVVTDLEMPGVGGRELAAHLTESRPGLKVLFLSGYPDDADLDGSFLAKPFSMATLKLTVREVLFR